MSRLTIQLDIRHFWHVGTGKGSGNHLDALVEKDAAGLPMIPGRMIKGLLRDAVNRRQQWGHFPEKPVEELFGSPGFSSEGVPRNQTNAGSLHFGNAMLDEATRQWLSQEAQQNLPPLMYQDLYSTAIEKETGVAKKHSLRGMQVTIPMILQCDIQQTGEPGVDWKTIIIDSLPLVRAVGAYRNRGLGRAILTEQKNTEADHANI